MPKYPDTDARPDPSGHATTITQPRARARRATGTSRPTTASSLLWWTRASICCFGSFGSWV